MKRSFLTTAFALLAMTIVFNSCEDEVDIRKFTQEEMDQMEPALLKDGAVVFVSQNDPCAINLYYEEDESSLMLENGFTILVGTKPDDMEKLFSDYKFMANTKYYWKLANTHFLDDDHSETEVRCFYYMTPYTVEAYNSSKDGDWSVILKWEHNDAFEGGSVTMTPHKDCNYDKTPIEVPVGQDSCYISAGDLGNQKYQIYHNWWDEANGKYYEPVVYDYNVTMNYNLNGELVPVPATAKGIFLNTDGYVADSQYNVYRYAKIGNRTWMLDDLRFNIEDDTIHVDGGVKSYFGKYCCCQITLESGLEMVLYSSEAYPIMKRKNFIPKGFHLATNEDWEDLETHFGVEPYNIETHPYSIGKKMFIRDELYQYLYDTITQLSRWVLDPIIIDDIRYIDSVYVGKNTLIREYLISDNEWIDNNDSTKRLQGYGLGFNAHPVGISERSNHVIKENRKGYGAFFMTSTLYNNDNQYLARVLASAYNGIGRIRVFADSGNHFFLFRCVKDE